MSDVRAAGFILFRRVPAIEYLLMQTSYGKHHWTPPKGHVDPGENDYQTALRETKEEAGVSADQMTVVPDFKVELRYNVSNFRDGKNQSKLVTYFLAEVDPSLKVVMSEEHQDFKWLSLEAAVKLAGFPDMAKALQTCNEYLTKPQSKNDI